MTSIPKSISSRRRLSDRPSRANFEAAYGPRNGAAIFPPTEPMLTILPGAPAQGPVGAEQREERLGHGEHGHEVHLELPAELIKGHVHQGPEHGDAGIVDQAHEGGTGKALSDEVDGCRNGARVRHVEQQRGEPAAELRGEARGVLPPAHASEDMDALPDQHAGYSIADAGGNPRDDNASSRGIHCAAYPTCSQVPDFSERNNASSTFMLSIASCGGVGAGPPSRTAREKGSNISTY